MTWVEFPQMQMAHCGLCNTSYPATHYHRCCGQGACPSCAALRTRVSQLEEALRTWVEAADHPNGFLKHALDRARAALAEGDEG